MTRSGTRFWTRLLVCALALPFFAGSTLAQPAAAQSNGAAPDKQEVALHYSLYWENFKNENYRDALPDLHWILDHAPGFPRDKDQNFERAVKAYEALSKEAEGADKRVMLDSALALFNRAVPVLQGVGAEVDEFEWTLKKGRFIQENIGDFEDRKEEAVEAYRKAYELQPMEIDPYYINVLLGDFYTKGEIGKALDLLRELDEKRGTEDAIKDLINKYFAIIPPDEQIAFLEKQLENDPENVEIITQLFNLYEKEGERDKMMALAPKLLQMDPTENVVRLLLTMHLQDENVTEAAKMFQQLEAMPGATIRPSDYYNMGIAQQGLNNFGEARTYFRKALDVDPEFKQALQAIADLYATAVSTCGVADRKGKGVFWLVADAYARAGDGAGAARFRAVFPSAEDIFYEPAWTEGATVSVSYGCRGLSISGSTTVRKSR